MPEPQQFTSLVLIEHPDGRRESFLADTPSQLQMGETLFVWRSAMGWISHEQDQRKRPIPMDHVIRVQNTASFSKWGEGVALPWVIFCKVVPDEYGANLGAFKDGVRVPKGQEAWRDSYEDGRFKR